MEQEIKKKYAFISYNHGDVKIAKWLQNKLESYKLPIEIDNEYEDSKYLRPIFRDKTDLGTGVLSEEICKHLESSKYLIVICSSNSSESKWVSAEVKYFIEDLQRLRNVIPFIIDVKSDSGREKDHFPQYLRDFIDQNPEKELLGINTDDGGKEMAFVRVVSHMLGVSFDELWKRHERERRKRIIIYSITTPIVIFALYYFIVPISLNINIKDEQHHLIMPQEGIVRVNNVEYRINSFDTVLKVKNVLGYFRGRNITISFFAKYYKEQKVDMSIGFGIQEIKQLQLSRDSTFAIYAGTIIDSQSGIPIENASIEIEDQRCYSDEKGYFKIIFPIGKQTMKKKVTIDHPEYNKYIREDEHPQNNLGYMLIRRK